MTTLFNQGEWGIKPLIEVATLKRGYDLPVQDRLEGPHPIFASNGTVGFHAKAKCRGPGVVTGRSGTIGKVHFVEDDFWPLNTSLYVTDFHGNDPKWVYYMLQSFGLERFSQGAGVPTLNRNLIHDVPVRVPTLPEQRRISAVLDHAEMLRAKRREALALLDSLTQSIFVEMFGDISENSKFKVGSIRHFVEANSGKPAKSVLSKDRTEIPIYGGNGINGWATSALYENPILIFGRVGQHCGNTYMSDGPSWVTDNAIVVQIFDTKKLNPVFVLHAFKMSSFSNRVKHLDLPFINQGMILDNPIPIPPISVQLIFAKRIKAVEAVKSSQVASLAKLDMLFSSLQHRAFRGEL